jgi:predicted acetyltransferase
MGRRSSGELALISPRESFERSYRSLVDEFLSSGERLVPFTLAFEYERFADLLVRLRQNSQGIGLPEGFVAHSSYWLVRGAEILGVSNLRHELTDALRVEGGHIGYGIRPSLRRQGFGKAILSRTLERARAIGLGKILLTCGKANVGSVKVILANGGVLDSEEFHAPRNEVLQRYWIHLAGQP